MDSNLRAFLLNPSSYPHSVSEPVRAVETHISVVFLTGVYAYKLKKAVRLPFLDFSALAYRRHFCEEELRLNKRYAPQLYDAVVPVYRQGMAHSFVAGGEAVEYLVRMRQFREGFLFLDLLERGELRESQIVELLRSISSFHREAELRPSRWGFPHVSDTIMQVLDSMRPHAPEVLGAATLEELRCAIDLALSEHRATIERRQSTHVRAVHGDLHLKNICVYEGRAVPFDGIEFSEELASCDVWADVAFLVMDLLYRGHPALAWLAMNAYLEAADDFEGVELLPLYIAYRAAVRALVSCIEFDELLDTKKRTHAEESAKNHVQCALQALTRSPSLVVAIGGFSGSGKSTLARTLAQSIGGVHIRSDAVRKHLLGIQVTDRAPPAAYSMEISERVYQGMLQRGEAALRKGGALVFDAVYGRASERDAVERFAGRKGIPFLGVWCSAPREVCEQRVAERRGDVSDANVAVVGRQFEYDTGPIDWKQLNTESPPDLVLAQCRSLLDALPRMRAE